MNTLSRRTWYLMANGAVAAWFVAAGVTLIVAAAGGAAPWLAVHVLLLGGATSAILVWSQHFSDTLLRKAGSRNALAVRLIAQSVGAVAVLVGVTAALWPVTLVGGIVVAAAVGWHGASLWVRLRRALPSRFRLLVRYYVAAALSLIGGITIGVIMARMDASSGMQSRLLAAHLAFNVLGWIGLTVVGTVILLWPTVLHARIAPTVDRGARIGLPLMSIGIAVMVVASLAGLRVGILPGLALYAVGLAVVGVDLVRQARQAPPTTYAGYSMGCALAWFAGCIVALGIEVAFARDWPGVAGAVASLLVPFGLGFVAQLITATSSYLLPVVVGGGPPRAQLMNAQLDRFALFRVIVVNGALLLALAPDPPIAAIALGVACVTLAAPLAFGIRALVVARRTPTTSPDSQTLPSAARAAARSQATLHTRSGAAMAAAGVVVLVAALGIAVGNAETGGQIPAGGQTTTVQMTMKDMRFHPSTIDVPAGNRLVIHVTNEDPMVHDLTLPGGITSGRLVAGESATVDAGIIEHSLPGWCSVTGHRQLGMVFSVVAEGAAGSNTAEGAGGSGGPRGSSGSSGGSSGSSSSHMPGMNMGQSASGPSAANDIDLGKSPAKNFKAYDPTVPAVPDGTVHNVTLTVRDTPTDVAPGVKQTLWTYNGTAPGPTLHGKVGDTFHVTLVNDSHEGHSVDFHAGSLAPNLPMRTIGPGQRLVYTFTATKSGIWLYHCSTMPMAAHIANGMYGAVIIDPPGLDPVAQQFVFVQGEYYLGPQNGVVDIEKLATENPDLVVFNGYANQYVYRPITVKAGERVRIWVLDAGPNRPTSFHVVGGQFDTVFFEGDYLLKDGGSTGTGGSQALALQPAQGGFVELTFPEPGDYSFVTHIMSDAAKGATGTFHVIP